MVTTKLAAAKNFWDSNCRTNKTLIETPCDYWKRSPFGWSLYKITRLISGHLKFFGWNTPYASIAMLQSKNENKVCWLSRVQVKMFQEGKHGRETVSLQMSSKYTESNENWMAGFSKSVFKKSGCDEMSKRKRLNFACYKLKKVRKYMSHQCCSLQISSRQWFVNFAPNRQQLFDSIREKHLRETAQLKIFFSFSGKIRDNPHRRWTKKTPSRQYWTPLSKNLKKVSMDSHERCRWKHRWFAFLNYHSTNF